MSVDLFYTQNTGAFLWPSGRYVLLSDSGVELPVPLGDTNKLTGYSGHGIGVNDPDLEGTPDVGPLPRGIYTIGEPFTHPTKGPLVMRLTPDTETRARIIAMGRGPDSFLIHGPSARDAQNHDEESSEGCIVVSHEGRVWLAANMAGKTLQCLASADDLPRASAS